MNERKLLYKGKAKSIYAGDSPDELVTIFRDDITAFDGEKHDQLQNKGRFNATASAYFMQILENKGIKTHFIRMQDPVTMFVKKLEMIPLEVIVRNIAAGSMTKKYPIKEGTILNPPVIVIDYKDDERHDPMINDEIIVALSMLTQNELKEVKETALKINTILSDYMKEFGIDLVDFKIEFGKHKGTIYLGDEVSMDSMRLWDKETGESLDKDVYRFDKGDVISVYEKLLKRIIPDN